MTMPTKYARAALATGFAAAIVTLASPGALASQADLDLLQSYVGNWSGQGTTTFSASGNSERVQCKLGITSPQATKLQYHGKCAVAGAVLTMNGTVAYDPASNRYQAAMTGNTPFAGTAVGRRSGETLSLSLQDKNKETGDPYDIASSLSLKGGNILIRFKVKNLNTGEVISANVPFTK